MMRSASLLLLALVGIHAATSRDVEERAQPTLQLAGPNTDEAPLRALEAAVDVGFANKPSRNHDLSAVGCPTSLVAIEPLE